MLATKVLGVAFVLACLSLSSRAAEPDYFLVTYSAGASWNEALSYQTQPGLKKHHEYLRSLYLDDIVVMGGPVTDINEDYLAVLLVRTGSIEQAESLVSNDPGVQTRLIRAEVVPWNVTMSSMRFVRRRAEAPTDGPDKTFSIKRIDPESRLNIED